MSRRLTAALTSFIVILLSYHAYRFPNRNPISTPSLPPPANSTATNHIIRFLRYNNAHELRAYLERQVKCSGWNWVERRNPAASFPTDFALVAIEDHRRDFLIGEFGKLELVKDVSLDLSYQRVVLSAHEEIGAGAFVDGKKKKRPGKIFTSMSFTERENSAPANASWRRSLMMQKSQVTSLFGADALWSKGYTGAKVKMAIFDTGIRANHPHFRKIKVNFMADRNIFVSVLFFFALSSGKFFYYQERTNWTNEDTLNDNLGHGTFVAGVIAGQDEECLGFAPDTEIYAFRVFTDAQVSYTSWFLDAFNYAIATKMDVLNLSIGGPDYLDLPFVEKVWEITANNIIMVSAIGNDGPLYGTLNNPADQSDVIGVGGIDYSDHIASFSSRGMSTWEIPHGLLYTITNIYLYMPIFASSVYFLLVARQLADMLIVRYGRVKPDVVAYGREIMGSKISTGCKSLSGTSVASPVVAGIVCLLVSIIPESKRKEILNPGSMKQALVEGASKLSGPNMYEQGAGRVDLLESYEILKSYKPRASIFPSVLDYMDCPYSWPFCRQPLYAGAMPVIFNVTILNGMGVIGYVDGPPMWLPDSEEGNLLNIQFTYSDVIWPWTGYLALHMQIKEEGVHFSGEIEGNVTVNVYRPPGQEMISLTGMEDHLHTNFHIMFNMLRDAGYYVETLGSPFTCFDANRYGTLLLVDLEDEYFAEEIKKLKDDIMINGLGLVVFADWYNVDSMMKMKFFDDNTRSWWTPVTGGANVPALNDLLSPFGIAFGDKILNGDFVINGEQSRYASGTDVVKFPKGGYLHRFPFLDSSESGATQNVLLSGMSKADSPILGLVEVGEEGRIAVYGDSNCLDSSHMVTNCYWLLKKILDFTASNIRDPVLFSDSSRQDKALHLDDNQLPSRRTDVNFSTYSQVVNKELICRSDSRFEVWATKGYDLHVRGRNHRLPGYAAVDLGQGSNSTPEVPFKKIKSVDKDGNSLGNSYLGYLYGDDQLDFPELVASHWLLPAIVAGSGFLVLWSFWRIRQRRRRRRKGSGSFNRTANP
ncbi:hypothetical protein SASPL_150835 [Salvia splendens]|uniref:Membrane-bound transcription factor site-1 protease n=1 Tax=Salvia splendens TaxID=180675 RepID=A0A8X8Z238_SALSN|nr:hypothetical protein SASPL_150835 [Salvia splendens]